MLDHAGAYQVIAMRSIGFALGLATGVATPVIIGTIPANFRILRTVTVVGTAYDGTTDLASVGYTADVDGFQDTGNVDIANADTTGGGDSQADAQPHSTFLGRAPQTAEWDLLLDLETNSDTTAGEVTIIAYGIPEPA